MRVCATCRFFEHLRCRRYAPRPPGVDAATPWPIVRADDWCGEHMPVDNMPERAKREREARKQGLWTI